jgi:hypothetical protein
MDRGLVQQALRRDGYRCVSCSSGLRFTLATHHVIPRHLGGADALANLTTLCANCHRTVHHLAVGRRLEGEPGRMVKAAFGAAVYSQIAALARKIRVHRERVLLAGNKWRAHGSTASGTLSLEEAIKTVVIRNGFEPSEGQLLRRIVRRAISALPGTLRERCAYRLVREGRYLSINVGNHLALRTPAYSDDGKRQDWDLILVWLRSSRPPSIRPDEWSKISAGGFRLAPTCTNVHFAFDEARSFGSADWKTFATAAQLLGEKRSRNWPSNVHL